MSSYELVRASFLDSLALHDPDSVGIVPGVTIAERTGVSLCSVLARKDNEAQLIERVRQLFSVELTSKPHYTRTSPIAFAWAGPSQWLVLGEGINARAFELQLRESLAGVAAVMDQSDGRTIVRISGRRARNALAKGIQIDLHPSAFRPGDTAVTAVAHLGVHFWQVDATPSYELAVFSSYAASFWEWIVDAAAEFGLAIEQA